MIILHSEIIVKADFVEGLVDFSRLVTFLFVCFIVFDNNKKKLKPIIFVCLLLRFYFFIF